MYHFESLDDIVSTLDRLSKREPPLVRVLPRLPGTKELRYMHLFSGDVPASEPVPQRESTVTATDGNERITNLEAEVAALKEDVAQIRDQLAAFRKQFE
jgi:uncharacterized protein YceH (UPF0502 family)